MESGTLTLADFQSSVEAIFDALNASNTEDSWKLESVDSSNHELVCNHNCQIENIPARIEYRVTYNEAYGVPVFLFRGSLANGSIVPLSYFWDLFCRNGPEVQQNLWSVISQTEHRFTGVPYFCLHPCKTCSLMSDIKPNSPKDYLSFWLSFIARYFDLYIPPAIAKQ